MNEFWNLVADFGRSFDHATDVFRARRQFHGESCVWCYYLNPDRPEPRPITFGHPDPAALFQSGYTRYAFHAVDAPAWVQALEHKMYYTRFDTTDTPDAGFTYVTDRPRLPPKVRDNEHATAYMLLKTAPLNMPRHWYLNDEGFPEYADRAVPGPKCTVMCVCTDAPDAVLQALQKHSYRLSLQTCCELGTVSTSRNVDQLYDRFFGVVET